MKFAVVIEKMDNNYSADIPDVPGCVSTGRTAEEAQHNIGEALAFHLEAMREDGQTVPTPTTRVAEMEVA